MSIGALVSIPDLQSEGLARLTELRGGYSVVRFLASGAEKTQESKTLTRWCLLPGTRVEAQVGGEAKSGRITARKLGRDAASGLLVYGFLPEGGSELPLREDAVSAVPLAWDPVEQLATVQFNDLRPAFAKAGSALVPEPWAAQTSAAREELLAWRDEAWRLTGGVVGLAAARVEALPHQWLVARRALADAKVRYLLADEVGLGKTIEAGLIIQSLLAMNPALRVLVVVPGALLSQWFLELHVRFGALPFTMLDQERLAGWSGNPWNSGQFVLASSRAVEGLEGTAAIAFAASKWDVVVVDECHRMRPGGVLAKRIAVLSKSAPHVLLLSATPARQHPDAWLALLALLQPQVWKADDLPAFQARLAVHGQVAALLARTLAGEASKQLAQEWPVLVPGDETLNRLVKDLSDEPATTGPARDALVAYVREHLQFDRRVVRNRRQVLARLAQAGGTRSVVQASRSHEVVAFAPDEPEQQVRKALAAYRRTLLGGTDAAAVAEASPRRIHWLLQLELAVAAHPEVLDRLLAMRATVLEAPGDFLAYRKQARADETLAQVLRNDLSERELSTHVAVSAACDTDHADEEDVLKVLRTAVEAWKPKRTTARLAALIERLKTFWADNPAEKVLVFTTHTLAVEPLAQALARAFGEQAVATFGAHQDTIEREDSARRFREDDRCPLLVSDPLGGEGRNFQFVSVVAHHDLPWSLAAVEQRIGRVDRLGRDGDIPSWVLAPSDPTASDAAWGELLHQSVEVFTASSSGLEFVADRVEGEALARALAGGGDAVRAWIPEAVALVAGERATRERQEEDCFQGDASAYAEAAAVSATLDTASVPAGAVARWVRGLGGEVRREEEHPRAWSLRTRYGDERTEGVYERAAALSHPRLNFFGIGHHLIDRLVDDAARATWCAASAWRRPRPDGIAPWNGVRAVFVLAPALTPLMAAGLKPDVLRRLFLAAAPRRRTVCAHADTGEVVLDEALAGLLAKPFSVKDGDKAVSAATNREAWTKPLLGGKPEQVTAWQAGVRRAAAAAQHHIDQQLDLDRAEIQAALSRFLDPAVAAAEAAASTATSRHGETHPEAKRAAGEAAEERKQADALRASVSGATWTLESIAFVAVT